MTLRFPIAKGEETNMRIALRNMGLGDILEEPRRHRVLFSEEFPELLEEQMESD